MNVFYCLRDCSWVAFHLVRFAHVYQGLALLHEEVLLCGDVDYLLGFEVIQANYLWLLIRAVLGLTV